MKKIITLMLCVVLLASCFTACAKDNEQPVKPEYSTQQQATLAKLTSGKDWTEYNEEWTPKKSQAIIMIHGLMDGSMYVPSTDGVISRESIYGLSEGAASSMITNMVPLLTSDAECFPTIRVRMGNMNDATPYSMSGMWANVYSYFNDAYSDSYDVLCWQYDWRQHLDNAAGQLDRFLKDCDYESVILVGHSMGTCVISRYLAMGEAQREKVQLFIPFGGPMLGSVDAAEFLFFTKDGLTIPEGGLMSAMATAFKLIDPTHTMAGSFTTLYHLMCSAQFLDTPYYKDGESCYKVDGKYVNTTEFLDYISAFPWAKGYMDEELGYADTKVLIKTLEDFQSKVFVDGKHVSQLVPTEYVIGVDVSTVIGTEVDAEGFRINRTTSPLGDGLVPAYSATAGLELTCANVHAISGANHMQIVTDDRALDVLDEIMTRLENGEAGNQ